MDNGTFENNVKIGKYFVLLVDLLGQNEFLSSDFFDSNGNLIDDQQEKANQVTDQILYIKNFFDGAFNSLKNPNQNVIKFLQEFSSGLGVKIDSEQIGEELKETFKLHLKTQQFSDTILCYLEIPNKNLIFCYNIMIVWMTILIELMRDSLFKHLPIRGIITYGYGWEIADSNFYGPALAKANHIEKEHVKYSRIVIDESILSFFKESAEYLKNINSELSNNMLDNPFLIFATDFDGQTVLDYLSLPLAAQTKYYKDLFLIEQQRLLKIIDFIELSKLRYKKEKNQKLCTYYTLLCDFFVSRLKFWGINIKANGIRYFGEIDTNFSPINLWNKIKEESSNSKI